QASQRPWPACLGTPGRMVRPSGYFACIGRVQVRQGPTICDRGSAGVGSAMGGSSSCPLLGWQSWSRRVRTAAACAPCSEEWPQRSHDATSGRDSVIVVIGAPLGVAGGAGGEVDGVAGLGAVEGPVVGDEVAGRAAG